MVAVLLPQDELVFRASSGREVMETLVAVIVLAMVWVAERRYRESESAADLFLVAALVVWVIVQLALNAAPSVLGLGEAEGRGADAATWQLLSGLLLVAAAFASQRPMGLRARRAATAGATAAVLLTALAAGAFLAGDASTDPRAQISTNLLAAVRDAPVTSVFQGACAALLATAAIAFWQRRRRLGDGFWSWIALACALGALARLNAIAIPMGLDPSWMSSADLARLAAAAAFAGAVLTELRVLWERAAQSAMARERRRLARELHDGAVQDLAFIVSQGARDRPHADPRQEQIALAAARALESTRDVLAGLTAPITGSVAEAIDHRTRPLAARWGLALDVEVDRHVALRAGELEDLLGVISEAISNAARHAGATHVRVVLTPGVHHRVQLRVSDDGQGFEPGAPPPTRGGFGLVSMRERASALGGELRLESEPGRGTTVEVALR